MEKQLILYPMFALVAWTMAMALVTIRRAYRAVSEGLNPEYFRFGKGFRAPAYMVSGYQHYSNLFEMPMLFYAAILTCYVTATTGLPVISLAWAYVVARLAHSRYHLANTNVPRRRDAFIASYFILLALWLIIGLSVTGMI